MLVAAEEGCHARAGDGLQDLLRGACGEQQRVAASLMNVDARVPAEQPAHAKGASLIPLWHRLALEPLEEDVRVAAAGAAHVDGPELLRVQVDERRAADEARVEAHSPGQTRLLVDREEALQRRQRRGLILQQREDGGAADAVVGAERRALRRQPLPLGVADAGEADGVRVEVELRVGVLLAHHVHVALEHDRGGVLAAVAPGKLEHEVAHVVLLPLEAALIGEGLHEILHRLLLARRPRDRGDGGEIQPERRRGEAVDDGAVARGHDPVGGGDRHGAKGGAEGGEA
mmetsp:Transcript_28255/g.90386  ORF Transcript_28255/g.90386 Transcript_28255/m.90386 type:complete len:287 (+) Transcript_28255:2468-3328(+)